MAAESLDGGANADAVIFTGAVSLNAASFANKTGVETFTTANATNSITLDGGYAIDSGTTITFDGSASAGSVQTFNVSASALNASLIGGSGNDVLIGGTGIDTLRGGSGADNMQLGAADGRADRVQYAAATDGGVAGANTGYDTITQFEIANDRFSFGAAFNGGAADLDDVLNNNAFTWATNAAANFNTTHEAMMITGLTDADLTQSGYANLLAAINGYGVTAGAGETGLFMVTGATHTAFYYYVESQASNTDVTAGEIRLLGDVSSLLTTANVEFY